MWYVYNMNGIAILSKQSDVKLPLIGSDERREEAEHICDNFILPEEKETK